MNKINKIVTISLVFLAGSLMTVGFLFYNSLKAFKEIDLYLSEEYTTVNNGEIPANYQLNLEELIEVGWVQKTSGSSHYTKVPLEKESLSTIRVGFFGGSYMAGVEASSEHNPASLANRLLQRAGFQNIEVLDFSYGAYGTVQAFDTW